MLRYFGAGGAFYTPGADRRGAAVRALPGAVAAAAAPPQPLHRATGRAAGDGFAWGGIAAPFWIALPANTALLEIWTKVGGTAFAADWAAGLTAPINEEWGKALGLVLLIGLAPRLVRSAYDGFIIGAFIGLGFQVFEDVLYVYNGAAQTLRRRPDRLVAAGLPDPGRGRDRVARAVQRDLLRRADVGPGPGPAASATSSAVC